MTAAQSENPFSEVLPPDRLRVLVVAGEGKDGRDGDPAISWQLAGILAAAHDVVLAVPATGERAGRGFAVVFYNRRNLPLLARDSDTVVLGPGAASSLPLLQEMGPLAAIPSATLMQGDLEHGRALAASASPGELAPGELLVIRPLPARRAKRGPSHYLARFRFHLKSGGPRQVAAKAAVKLKRKMGRGR